MRFKIFPSILGSLNPKVQIGFNGRRNLISMGNPPIFGGKVYDKCRADRGSLDKYRFSKIGLKKCIASTEISTRLAPILSSDSGSIR